MAMIQSHINPYKSLKQHVEEVGTASNAILEKHSISVQTFIAEYIEYVVKFHDLGKAIPEFQKYIKNPKNYTGNRRNKAHAPVSMLFWLLFARDNSIHKDVLLLVASAVWRHHGDFPTFKSLLESTLYEYEDDFKISEYPINKVRSDLNLDLNLNSDADEFDIEDVFEDDFIEKKSFAEAAELKVKALMFFSILLEADRTFLALPEEYLKLKMTPADQVKINQEIVSSFLIEKSKTGNQNKILNQYRTNLRNTIIANSCSQSKIESITVPTGLGKTMMAAEWALKHRNQNNVRRKVIIVLPFLSIIDQTVKEYKKLFTGHNTDSLILEAHSIAERKYVDDSNEEQNSKFNNAIDFISDTWDYDFIITTFDQFLYTLLSSKNKYLMRFHNLADALIIIDEIQALPLILWEPLSVALNLISEKINTKTLIMSATQPDFIQTSELVSHPEKIFARQNRYELILNHTNSVNLKNFIENCIKRIDDENWHSRRGLIVLNTRASARAILDSLENKIKCDVFFLSADVTPKERLANIEEIKKNKPCLVIATQCIEAGVDIDMDFAIRDFAPLDSIVQCAGRCNRNGLKKRAKIEIITLINKNGSKFSGFIYDKTLLEKTAVILAQNKNSIPEENIFPLVADYFRMLKNSMDIGRQKAEDWGYWREELDIKKLLRNDNSKYCFIVTSQDEHEEGELALRDALVQALEIEDIWERKRKIRSLKPRLAKLTISVWANKDIIPEEIAEPLGCFYLLKDKYYTSGKGLNLKDLDSNASSCIF